MKIEINVGAPAKKEHIGPRSQFAATVKVGGKPFGDEYVGMTRVEALKSLCSELLRKDTIDKMVVLAGKK